MEVWKRQRKILAAFAAFLMFMFLCTLISRSVYASKLPQVTVETPRRMAISHTVKAEGIVHQGREYAVTALSGLRVRTVYASVGDRVTEETLLFDLDMEDLRKQIQEKELEIKKLQLQIASMEQNRSLDAQKQQTESARAQEDYARAEQKAQEALERAQEDLEDAEDAYEDHKDTRSDRTSDEARRAAQAAYDAWTEKEASLRSAAEQAQAACAQAEQALKEAEAETAKLKDSAGKPDGATQEQLDAAQDAEQKAGDALEAAKKRYDDAKAAYDAHAASPVPKPDYSAEDAQQEAWEEKKASLKDAVEAAERAVEDAEQDRSDAVLDAGRKVADSRLPADADSSLEVSRLELASLQTELSAYRKVQDASGQVYPEAEGIVTRIQVSPGERVGDGAAVVYADLTSPMQFQVSLTKEQKKYVNQGDDVSLQLGNAAVRDLTVDYVAENEMNPELYDARVFLPDQVGTIGQSGSFEVEAQSETFSCCIPLNALHEDASQRKFVYIVSERSGILGTELAAEMVYVRVLDQNASYAAIEEGVIGRETELIVSSTEALEDRDVIRYKE